MFINKKNTVALVCSTLFIAGSALLPVPAHAGFLGKLTKAAVYPVKKIAGNTSVDTHRVLQKNSVEKGPGPAQTRQNVIVKPDGNKVPANP
jgi:hypothetical protein